MYFNNFKRQEPLIDREENCRTLHLLEITPEIRDTLIKLLIQCIVLLLLFLEIVENIKDDI